MTPDELRSFIDSERDFRDDYVDVIANWQVLADELDKHDQLIEISRSHMVNVKYTAMICGRERRLCTPSDLFYGMGQTIGEALADAYVKLRLEEQRRTMASFNSWVGDNLLP